MTPEEVARWRETQIDSELALPTWRLRQKSKAGNDDAKYEAWRSKFLATRKATHAKFEAATGVKLSFAEFEKLDFQYYRYSTRDHQSRWILEQIYENSESPLSFATFVRHLKWQSENTTVSFEEWNAAKDEAIRKRYLGSHSPLPFETWRKHQDNDILDKPVSFIACKNSIERRPYLTSIVDGCLVRNDHPLDTTFGKTGTNGEGWEIFVIDADDELYSASHVSGMFHHSSFRNLGAVRAAGEFKTDMNGKILELCNKSGHYQPAREVNLSMLSYFAEKRVDLSNVKFTLYGEKGPIAIVNAMDYLNADGHIEGSDVGCNK